ncbi:MAG: SpoIIE family protein phosphatase, partial [Nocardioides sp.]
DHLPPWLVNPNGATEPMRGTSDWRLGVNLDRRRSDQHTPLPAGATVLFFTDGLVERRGEDLDKGLRRLADSAGRHVGRPVEELVDAVIYDLVGDQADDDVVVLAVRLT